MKKLYTKLVVLSWRRLRYLYRLRSRRKRLASEMRQHVEMHALELERLGMDRSSALREARIAFGGLERFREEAYDSGGFRWIEWLYRSLCLAIRRTRQRMGLSLVCVSLVALSIGLNSTVFAFIEKLLIDPFGIPNVERVVEIGRYSLDERRLRQASAKMYQDISSDSKSFEHVGIVTFEEFEMRSDFGSWLVDGASCSASMWKVLNVEPILGRVFEAQEDELIGNPLVLSYGSWKARFGGSETVLGERIQIDGIEHQVVGVMPEGFNLLNGRTEVWHPFIYEHHTRKHWSENITRHFAMGRLKQGVTVEAANLDLLEIFEARIGDDHSVADLWERLNDVYGCVPVEEFLSSHWNDMLTPLMGTLQVLALVMFVAGCLNVSVFFFAQGRARRREFGMRLALGASSGDLRLEMLVEVVLLVFIGGIASIAVTGFGIHWIRSLVEEAVMLPLPSGFGSAGAFTVSFGAMMACMLVFSMLPNIWIDRKRGSVSRIMDFRGGSRITRGGKWLNWFIGFEAIVSALLLSVFIGVGLNAKRMSEADIGFSFENLYAVKANLPVTRLTDREAYSVIEDVRRNLSEHAKISNVAFATRAPLMEGFGVIGGYGLYRTLNDIDRGKVWDNRAGVVSEYYVSPEFFDLLKIQPKVGRLPDIENFVGLVGESVIDERVAREDFEEDELLGDYYLLLHDVRSKIVGVVPEGIHVPHFYNQPIGRAVYTLLTEETFKRPVYWIMKSDLERSQLEPIVERIVSERDPEGVIGMLQPLDRALENSLVAERFSLRVIGAFSFCGLAFLVLGISCVAWFSTRHREKEIGIRIAIGGGLRSLLKLVLGRSLLFSIIGCFLGLAATVLVWPLLESKTNEISDLLSVSIFAAVLLNLGVVLLVSIWTVVKSGRGRLMSLLNSD